MTNLPGSFELLFPILFTCLPCPPQMLPKCPPSGGRRVSLVGLGSRGSTEAIPLLHSSCPPLQPTGGSASASASEHSCKCFFFNGEKLCVFFFFGYTLAIPHLTPSSPRPRSCSQDTGILGEPSMPACLPAFLSSLSSSPASSSPYWIVTQLHSLFSLLIIIFSTLPVSSFGWPAKMSVTPGSLPTAHHLPLLFLELPILSKYV